MAFSTAQKTLVHEILGLFQGGTFDWFDYNDRVTGVITSVPTTNQVDFSLAVTRLNTIFSGIESGSDGREARIGTILSEYSDVSLDTATISTGGGGGAAGARFDPAIHRRHQKKLLETHLGIRVRASSVPQGGHLASGFEFGSNIPMGR